MINDIKIAVQNLDLALNNGTNRSVITRENGGLSGWTDIGLQLDIPWEKRYGLKMYLCTVPNSLVEFLPMTLNEETFKSFLYEYFSHMTKKVMIWDHCQITEDFLLGHS